MNNDCENITKSLAQLGVSPNWCNIEDFNILDYISCVDPGIINNSRTNIHLFIKFILIKNIIKKLILEGADIDKKNYIGNTFFNASF